VHEAGTNIEKSKEAENASSAMAAGQKWRMSL
jgi:hypothetical protein